MATGLDRRELLHRAAVLLGGAISASATAGVLAGCVSTPGAPAKATFFTPGERKAVAAMAEQIIPRTDTPGAIDAGVPSFIENMLAGYYQDKERDLVRAGLQRTASDANALRGKPFADLTAEDQVTLMTGYDREAYAARTSGSGGHFFRMMKELTIIGYCLSEQGATKQLRYEQNPGPFRGDVPLVEIGKAWQS